MFFPSFFLPFYVTFTCAPRSRLQVIVIVGLPEFSHGWHQCYVCGVNEFRLRVSIHARLIVYVNRRLRWKFFETTLFASSFELPACTATVYGVQNHLSPQSPHLT